MVLVKKLDVFVLKKFLLVFLGAFFITLFVFMMQFTWRYVDELIGKGLTVDVLAEFFWYMAITLVPMSLPLSVLLASLISFGNMGERLELLSMKAAGVPLVRIMLPVLLLAAGLSGTSFYFQNKTAPEAQLKLRTLLLSMRQTSPALEIPEGVFYNGVPGFNLYVDRKDVGTGMLYGLMIYKNNEGFDRAQIVVADSGRMEMTEDKLHLVLDIWQGEQFENLRGDQTRALGAANQPYDRETFGYKRFIIDFDSNFEKMDEEQLRGMAQAKNLRQIEADIDSVSAELDSVGRDYYREARARFFKPLPKAAAAAGKGARTADFDSLLAALPPERVQTAAQLAHANASSYAAELEWKSVVMKENEYFIRRHWKEWHQKFTLSLACLFFFFIGAPLGSIIRKGGLGLPAVISVIIFIIYYIIDTGCMKMARDGSLNMVVGMWMSSAVLAPVGVFLTYKANSDSVVFNLDAYLGTLKRLLGFRSARHIFRKEVIIQEPDYERLAPELAALRADTEDYSRRRKLYRAPNYLHVFFRSRPDRLAARISDRLEDIIEELSNTRTPAILHVLNSFPVIYVRAHTAPFESHRLNVICGILLPVGAILWLRIWRFRLRLFRDMKQIVKGLDELIPLIEQEQTT
ncbi:MAG: LptF/LptG family permease [Alloprevotella sp.]|nr:LptF/LptG family permease [Alloprevotella sp.]